MTNNTAGTAGPVPVRASVKGTLLRVFFDGDLVPRSTPAGKAFTVEAMDRSDATRKIAGTGTVTISRAVVTVELAEAVQPDELASVSYDKPDSNPLQSVASGNAAAASFERFGIESVEDGIPPKFAGAEAMQIDSTPDRAKVIAYFDEPLDTNSVPATTHFNLLIAGNVVTVASVAIEGNAVTLNLDQALADGTSIALTYAPGTNPIQDAAGNARGGITHS